MIGQRQRGRAGDQQPGTGECLGERGVVAGLGGQAVVHRRYAEQHRAGRGQLPGHRVGAEAPQVVDAAAAAQRSEDAEDQAVDMEERQGVDEDVVGGPLPGVLQGVEGVRNGAPGEDNALGRPGRAGGVDDQGRSLVARFVRKRGRLGALGRLRGLDVEPGQCGERARQLGARFGQDE